MTAHEWLAEATKTLSLTGVSSARLDALILLEDHLGKDRAWILAHNDLELNDTKIIDEQILRRVQHEPLAYIRKKSEFYGRTFAVSPDTLQPRPETETLVELFLECAPQYETKTIVDVGTGSGCIAITIKQEFPESKVLATEISSEAIRIAEQNASILKSKITILQGNLLEPVDKDRKIDAVVSNLPYVPNSHTINQAALHEPKLAIFGGEDGLDLYRELFTQINNRYHRPKLIITESLPPQHNNLTAIASSYGYQVIVARDFIQVFARD